MKILSSEMMVCLKTIDEPNMGLPKVILHQSYNNELPVEIHQPTSINH